MPSLSDRKVAVVTGSNRGIGLEIVHKLLQDFDGDVFLTARDPEKAHEAIHALSYLGLVPKFHKLEVTKKESVESLRDHLMENYGGLDILINNAAIIFFPGAPEPYTYQATETLGTDYFAVRMMCEVMYPILRPGARVVNMGSRAGHLLQINGNEPTSTELREKFARSGKDLTLEEVDELMEDFIDACKQESDDYLSEKGWPNGKPHPVKGFPSFTYRVAKAGIAAMSRIHQSMFDKDPREDIVVNFVHPGYCNTALTANKGVLSPQEGSVAPVYAALLPPKTDVKGQFIWTDCSVVDWVNGPLPKK